LLAGASTAARADYPDRPITITVGFAPGGTGDVSARILAERLTKSLGVAMVVDNKPGAGGSIAAATAAATPDGYRIMLADPGAFAINPIMQPQYAKYDPLSDFTPVALVGQSPLILVVPACQPRQVHLRLLGARGHHPVRR
jgi:tripartite-type tricarboxylate transporter receptor subunit TctC